MICNACGAEMAEGSVFCPKCGERMEGDSMPAGVGGPSTASATATEKFKEAARERADFGPDQEDHLWQGSYSPKAMIGSWLLGIIVTVAAGAGCFMTLDFGTAFMVFLIIAAIVWIGLVGLLLYRRLSVHYQLTSQRFIHKEGILRQVTDRIEVIDMDDVTFTQGIIQRMLGVGTIKITSSDRSHPELWMYGIDDVQHVATLIDDNRRKERRRRGLHIEAI